MQEVQYLLTRPNIKQRSGQQHSWKFKVSLKFTDTFYRKSDIDNEVFIVGIWGIEKL